MFNQYQPNLNNMQQYLQEENAKSSSGGGPNWWSFPKGMSSVRILPPWDPTGRVALPVFMHPIEFQGEGMSYKKYNWTCVNKTFNKPCQICEGLAGIAEAGVDISKWEANRRQFYFNAIVMHDPQQNSGSAPGTHVVLKAPKMFYDWVIAQITNPMIGDITNVQNGIDVFVTKEGEGLGTNYTMTLSPNGRTPIPQEYLEKITDLYNLDDVFSGGFDQAQIDEMVNHLKKSAGVLSNGIPQAVNQMAGYTQAPQQFAPAQMPVAPQQNSPGVYPQGGWNYQQAPTTPSVPVAQPNPMAVPSPAPFSAQAPIAPVQPPVAPVQPAVAPAVPAPQAPTNSPEASNLPKCFGQYDSGSVNCVVCPMEIQCSQSK